MCWGFASKVRILLGRGQYRNAVASGKCDTPRLLSHNVDPTLPRYGTDRVQQGLFEAKPRVWHSCDAGLAPKARNMIARGIVRSEASTSPLVNHLKTEPRPEGPIITDVLRPFRAASSLLVLIQGRRASRLPLAIISRAFGAVSYLAPSALCGPNTSYDDD